MNICLVYLGDSFPAYVKANILYLKRTFPDKKIWFLSDNEKSLRIASKLNVKTWRCDNPLSNWAELRNSELDFSFRKGFYPYTLGRFSALNDFMKNHIDESVLHIEADVWLAPNFPFDLLDKINEEIAFPLERKNVAIPSTVFFKNQASISHLFKFLTIALKDGITPIDMFLLATYAATYPKLVHILPTAARESTAFNSLIDSDTNNLVSKNFENYSGIFDSSTWGQFLLGIDPKNYLGIRLIYHTQKNHAIKTSNAYISIDDKGNIKLRQGKTDLNLYSLHVHSKDLRIFQTEGSKLLKKRVTEIRSRTKYEMNFGVMINYFSIKLLIKLIKSLIIK